MSTEQDLDVWRISMDLAVELHRLSVTLPDQERYGLADQIRRASASIPANIAEGNARHSRREFLHFLSIAEGSLAELSTHLQLSLRLGLVSERELATALCFLPRVGKMLTQLVRSLRSTI